MFRHEPSPIFAGDFAFTADFCLFADHARPAASGATGVAACHHDQHCRLRFLDAILPDFEQKFNARVDVVAVGTGQAIEIGTRAMLM